MVYRENEFIRTKWEYCQYNVIFSCLDEELERLGLLGWELVSVCRIQNDPNSTQYRMFFKRDVR